MYKEKCDSNIKVYLVQYIRYGIYKFKYHGTYVIFIVLVFRYDDFSLL